MVTQIIEFYDFRNFDNFTKIKSFEMFEVYFGIYRPFAIDREAKWGGNLILYRVMTC